MSEKLCLGCMDYYDPDQGPCSCGFDPEHYTPASHHLPPGTMLNDRYQVGRVIGEGGFGITYTGRDTLLDLRVAIKEFFMSGFVNRNNTYSMAVEVSVGENGEQFKMSREKFLAEARVLAKFAHEPGIVGIQDFFEANNTAYIAMEYLDGITLKAKISKEDKIYWEDTLDYMEPIFNSLAKVHKKGIIHRDISPDNIMLLKDGRVNLLDFGAAREVAQRAAKGLSVILKPGFAPEEQHRSKGDQGPWSDIYALCATMYCAITGLVPDDAVERLFEDHLDPVYVVEPSCPKIVSDVIMKGMALKRQDRYQCIEDLQAALHSAAELAKSGVLPSGTATQNAGGPFADADVMDIQSSTPVPKAVRRSAADANATVYAQEIPDEMPVHQDQPYQTAAGFAQTEFRNVEVDDNEGNRSGSYNGGRHVVDPVAENQDTPNNQSLGGPTKYFGDSSGGYSKTEINAQDIHEQFLEKKRRDDAARAAREAKKAGASQREQDSAGKPARPQAEKRQASEQPKKGGFPKIIVVLILIVAVGVGVYFALSSGRTQETDFYGTWRCTSPYNIEITINSNDTYTMTDLDSGVTSSGPIVIQDNVVYFYNNDGSYNGGLGGAGDTLEGSDGSVYQRVN